MGSRRRAQSPSSVNKKSQCRLACVFRHAHPAPRCGYKGRARANTQQLFASEPSLANLQSVCKARLTALVLRRVSGGCCPVLHSFSDHAATSLGASALLKENFRAISSCREDPRRCPIAVMLSFLQDGLERRLSPSTFKVYVAAIAAHHDAVDGKSLGKHDLVIRFLRGARRLNPPHPHLVPSWDLPSVLSALRGAPFEPLQSVELKFLSLKTVLSRHWPQSRG